MPQIKKCQRRTGRQAKTEQDGTFNLGRPQGGLTLPKALHFFDSQGSEGWVNRLHSFSF